VSRRSLAFPSFETLDETNLDMLSANFATIPTREFFSRLGIAIEKFPKALETVGLTPETLIRSHMHSERMQIQRLFKLLEPVVLQRSAHERPLLLEYLRDIGCLDAGNVALFDIGWGGTLQYALASVLRSAGATAKLRAIIFRQTNASGASSLIRDRLPHGSRVADNQSGCTA
jgi:hypothetical protein